MKNFSIIHEETLKIEDSYRHVKEVIIQKLNPWIELITFDDNKKQIIYKTEGPLIPEDNGKIPVLILLSNPHPHSVLQGMILSPNRSGKPNPFWNTMEDSGYFRPNNSIGPAMMIKNEYESPFRFFMAVLLPFPSEYPDHLIEIFRYDGYRQMLKYGTEKVNLLVKNHRIGSIICFTKLTYDALSQHSSPNGYTNILISGQNIQSHLWGSDKVNTFLTFPTGWRYVKDAPIVKADSLRRIFGHIVRT